MTKEVTVVKANILKDCRGRLGSSVVQDNSVSSIGVKIFVPGSLVFFNVCAH